MKKTLLLLTILALILSLCLVLYSCDKPNTDEGKEPSSNSSQNTENNTDNSQNNDQNVTVTFDTKGGSAIDSVQVEVGKKVTQPQDPQKEGYTFDGWYLEDEEWSFVDYTVTENMTLVAKWVLTTYTITYVGDVTHLNKKTYTVEDETFDLTGTGKEYYEFLGWYEDEEFTKQVTKIEKGTTGNKTLYAKTEYTPLLFRLMEDDYAVVSCDADVTSVVIPSTYKGKSVTSIGELAFHNRTKLTSIEIPNSVTSIGDYAFQNCNSLTSIEIPNSVTTIGKRVFVGCISLTSVEMPNSVTSIGESAFENCTSLISIELPNSVTSIGDSAFKGCTDLAGVEISNNLTSIGRWVFSNCTSLTSVKIPNSITSIGYGAFSDCTGLTSVEIPSNVTSIDSSAFQGCTDLTSVAIGAGVTSIGYGAFLGCVSLTNINIPNSVTSIAERAFYKCISLTSIEIPTGITSIADYVFYGCAGLTDIEIPNSVTSIGDHAFEGCQGLTSVNIPNSITSIGESAFKDCIGLTGISIPNSVTSIRGGVFSGCTGIAYNEYDNGLYLGNEENPYLILITAKDKSITSCEINEKTRIIQDGAFQGCTALASIIIPNSVGSVGYGAFYNCNSLTIYCEAESRPKEWSGYWNASSCPVVWGYKQGE